MKVPETFRGMKKVKEYPNHVLYEKTIKDIWGNEYTTRESFKYQELGINTPQIRDRAITADMHL